MTGGNGTAGTDPAERRGARARAAARRIKALSLRQAGASFRDIAAQLGVSRQQAYRDVDVSLGELARLQRQKAEKLRALEISRLDRLLLAVWPRAQGGDYQAVDRAVRILERITSLQGLEAPFKIDHYDQTQIRPCVIPWRVVGGEIRDAEIRPAGLPEPPPRLGWENGRLKDPEKQGG